MEFLFAAYFVIGLLLSLAVLYAAYWLGFWLALRLLVQCIAIASGKSTPARTRVWTGWIAVPLAAVLFGLSLYQMFKSPLYI